MLSGRRWLVHRGSSVPSPLVAQIPRDAAAAVDDVDDEVADWSVVCGPSWRRRLPSTIKVVAAHAVTVIISRRFMLIAPMSPRDVASPTRSVDPGERGPVNGPIGVVSA